MEIPKHLGKYEIGAPVGRGGMGFVYEGKDSLIGRPVAIKFLRPELMSPERRQRFGVEARTAARLVHPNLVTIYDVGEYREIPFIVTQYLAGRSFRDLIVAGDLTPEQTLGIFADIAQALVMCHGAGIIHRDIKPSNVRLSADGRAVLLDFGIAKMADESKDVTRVGVVVGSAPYMSPEQARGEVVDGRSDLFSLGAMMYQAYAGTKPFEGPSSRREVILLRQRLRDQDLPPALTTLGVPEEIDWIVRRLLAPNPEHRFPSARALADAVAAVSGALSAGGARRGERLDLRTRLAPDAARAWLPPALASAAVLLLGLVVLVLARPRATPRPAGDGSDVVQLPPPPVDAGDAEWDDALAALDTARGTTDRLMALAAAAPDRPHRVALVPTLRQLVALADSAGRAPADAHARLARLAADPTLPAAVRRLASRRATGLVEAREARLAPLRRALAAALDGRDDEARAQLAAVPELRGPVEQELGVLATRAVALIVDAARYRRLGQLQAAQRALLELSTLGTPELRDLARRLLDALDTPLRQLRDDVSARRAEIDRLVAASQRDRALAALRDLPPGAADRKWLAGVRARLGGVGRKARPDVLFAVWVLEARALLDAGRLDALQRHLASSQERFERVPNAEDTIDGFRRAHGRETRAAVALFGRFVDALGKRARGPAAVALDRLRYRYPTSRFRRDAEQLWEKS